jgi:hypothetical protein
VVANIVVKKLKMLKITTLCAPLRYIPVTLLIAQRSIIGIDVWLKTLRPFAFKFMFFIAELRKVLFNTRYQRFGLNTVIDYEP